VDQPTKGLSVDLDYSDCGIAYGNVLDFIASSQKTRVSQSPKAVPGKNVSVEFDGWVFPRSGLAFVWVLDHGTSTLLESKRPSIATEPDEEPRWK
jgi:hypothetical protein